MARMPPSDYCRFPIRTYQLPRRREVISNYYTKDRLTCTATCGGGNPQTVIRRSAKGGADEGQAVSGQAARTGQYIMSLMLSCGAHQFYPYSHAGRKELALAATRTDLSCCWSEYCSNTSSSPDVIDQNIKQSITVKAGLSGQLLSSRQIFFRHFPSHLVPVTISEGDARSWERVSPVLLIPSTQRPADSSPHLQSDVFFIIIYVPTCTPFHSNNTIENRTARTNRDPVALPAV